MAALSRCYSSLFDGLNAEVQIRWLQMVVRNSFYPELPKVHAFLLKHVSSTESLAPQQRSHNTNRKSLLPADVPDVHHAAVRRPGGRGDEVLRRGGFQPDSAPPASQPQTDITADAVPDR